MAIYIFLIIYVLLVPLAVNQFNTDFDKRIKKTTFWSVFGVYLVLALKKYTVGIDIPGYREQYYLSANKHWKDYDYVYFEDGYILLEKVFSKNDFSFQFFTAVVYAVICIGLYLFIKKYSKNPTISVLFFICYQFLLFNITGLRQAIASGICMIAFVLADCFQEQSKKKKIRIFFGFALMLLATQIHRSSVIFLISLLILWISKTKSKISYIFYFVSIPFAYIIRSQVLGIVTSLFGNVDKSQLSLGLNFVFLILLAIFIIYSQYVATKKYQKQDSNILKWEKKQNLLIRMSLCVLPIYILLSGTGYLRGAMYFSMFYIVSVPTAIENLNRNDKLIFKPLFVIFLIIFFYFDTLAPATFNICPYQFFWE